jgi:hypothetical protein
MILHKYSYRFAQEVLLSNAFSQTHHEAISVFEQLPAIRRGDPLWTKEKKKSSSRFVVEQDGMNRWLDAQFRDKFHWEYHPRITPGSKLEGDYRKDRIQIEVQFGNMARWTYDILKFQICYSQNQIDIGILVVPLQWFARLIGDNIAYYERILRELPHAKLSITLPILVIGLDPADDAELVRYRPVTGQMSEDMGVDEDEG